MDRRIISKHYVTVIGSIEHTSWIYHYERFVRPDKDIVILSLGEDNYTIREKDQAIRMGWTVFHEPIDLSELQKNFSTDVFQEVNWDGVKHEFWAQLLGRIQGTQEPFVSFLIQSRFPVHEAEQFFIQNKNLKPHEEIK